MGSDLGTVIYNQLIGALIGTVVSFVVSWYFYRKADFPSKVTAEMTENVLLMLIQDRLSESFEFNEEAPRTQLPKDLDVPHILHFWLSKKRVKPGESFIALFRVEDTGLNFYGPNIIEVTEVESGVSFPVTRQGHGYYSCQVNCPSNATPGLHAVRFKLTDSEGKSHAQSIKVDVVP
jgi:hypothetical protein